MPTREAHPLIRMGELSAAFMAATFVVFARYGVFAAAFGALAARLAFAERRGRRARGSVSGACFARRLRRSKIADGVKTAEDEFP